MAGLPQDVGSEDGERQRGPQPDPGMPKRPAMRGRQHAHQDPETEERHRVLVVQPDTGQRAEGQPELLVPGLDDADHEPRPAHPEQGLECVHRQDVVQEQVDGGHGHARGRQALAEPPRPHLARERAGEEDLARRGEGGKETDGRKRLAEQCAHEACDQRDECRLVHVPPVEPLGAGQVVQLVPEVAVLVGEEHMEQEERSGHVRDDRTAAGPGSLVAGRVAPHRSLHSDLATTTPGRDRSSPSAAEAILPALEAPSPVRPNGRPPAGPRMQRPGPGSRRFRARGQGTRGSILKACPPSPSNCARRIGSACGG